MVLGANFWLQGVKDNKSYRQLLAALIVSGAHLLTSKDAWLDTFQAIIALNATRQCIGKQTNNDPRTSNQYKQGKSNIDIWEI